MDTGRAPVELWEPTLAVLDAASSPSSCALTVGLEQLLTLVDADRADGGYVSSPASVYRPSVAVAKSGVTAAHFSLPATDPVLSSIFTTGSAVAVTDFASDVPDGLCRTTMLGIDTRAVVARRLEVDERVFGLVCLDWVGDAHAVDSQAMDLVDLFISSVLAPVLAMGGSATATDEDRSLLSRLSDAEVAAVRLAAKGMSYREIAASLGKSVNTIDHQLLRARRQVGARNTAQLVRMLITELEADPDRTSMAE